MIKGVLIQGSARSKGNTHTIVSYVQQHTGFDVIDLNSLEFTGYDYLSRNREDDFLPTIRKIANEYELLVFATPVYWYAMSGLMKNFFDRITDCLREEKDTGRKLRGKTMAMISCGSDADCKQGFEMPFQESAHYLGMHYAGSLHTWIEEDSIPTEALEKLDVFITQLKTL